MRWMNISKLVEADPNKAEAAVVAVTFTKSFPFSFMLVFKVLPSKFTKLVEFRE